MAAFLRGLADAEGNVGKNRKNLGHISIINTNRQLREYALSLLKALGISAKLYKRREKAIANINGRVVRRRRQFTYVLRVHRKADIFKFREVIGFAIKRKQEILERVGQT